MRWITLDRTDAGARFLWHLLDGSEQARADRFRFAEDRDAYMAAHALLRLMLSDASGRPPREWHFLAMPSGKPYIHPTLGQPELRFSLSHTRGMVACAVGRTFEMGVDVEVCSQTIPVCETAQRLFAPSEVQMLEKLDAEERLSMFTRLWTLKEAYAKATGRGIAATLDDLVFRRDAGSATLSPHGVDDLETWQFHEFEPGSHHKIALAVQCWAADLVELRAAAFSVRACLERGQGIA